MKTRTDVEKCGNCEYWTGSRKPVFDAHDLPKIEIYDEYGNCENEQSRFCGNSRKKGMKCKYFFKWTDLF